MSEGQSTDDLERELAERKKSRRGGGAVKKHGVSVGAVIIAAFGAYEGYSNKEVVKIAATIAAEAKVDGVGDRELLVEEVNKLKQKNAELEAGLAGEKEINKERYTQLRDWLKSVSRRGSNRPIPAAAAVVITAPEPRPPAPVVKLEKKRPKKPKEYRDRVQRVLEEKGFK